MIVCGIDPGIAGSIACLSNEGLIVERMPILSVEKKFTLDISAIDRFLVAWKPDHVFIEKQLVLPKQGIVSGFRTGYHFGILVGLIQGKGLPLSLIAPATWKKSMQCPADKDAARYRASQLFPNNANDWKLKRDDGLAEA